MPLILAAVALTIEKVGVIVAGGGLGTFAYGLSCRKPPSGREPSPFYRPRIANSGRNMRRGLILMVAGGLPAALAYLFSHL